MNRDYTRSKLQIGALCALLVLAIIFAALTAVSRQHKGISFEEMFMEMEEQDGKIIYTGRKHGEDVTVICYEEDGADVVDFTVGDRYRHLCRVEYPAGNILTEWGEAVQRIRILRDGLTIFSGGYGAGGYYAEDGSWDPMLTIKAGYSDPWYDYEFTAGDICYFADGPETVARGSWVFYAVMVFLSLIAAVEIAFPETLFYLNHFLSVKDPEPSDFFWAMHRIGCVVIPLMILAGYIFGVRMIQ